MRILIAGSRISRTCWTIALTALLAFGGCAAPSTTDEATPAATDEPVAIADESALIAAHKELIQAFENGEAETIGRLLDPTRKLLIFHPFLENRFDGIEDATAGLSRMTARMTNVDWTEVHPAVLLDGDVGWITSQVLIKADSMEQPFVGRGTEIWLHYEDGWRLVHGHWSVNGELAGS